MIGCWWGYFERVLGGLSISEFGAGRMFGTILS